MRRSRTALLGIGLAVLAGCVALTSCTPARDARAPQERDGAPPVSGRRLPATDRELEQLVRDVLGDERGRYGVVVKDLQHGTGAALNPDKVFYAASLFKLAVMVEAYRQHEAGRLRLDALLPVTAADAAEDLGTLDLLDIAVGDRLTVGELVELMVTVSDNTASVMLRNALGRQQIDRTMRALGLRATSVATPALPTTAADMAVLLEAITTGRAVSPRASRAMEQLLRQQRVRDRIPAGLPAGVAVGNKTGNWEHATHDVAIVYAPAGTYLLVVLSDHPHDGSVITELSRQVYAYYHVRRR